MLITHSTSQVSIIMLENQNLGYLLTFFLSFNFFFSILSEDISLKRSFRSYISVVISEKGSELCWKQ